MTDLGEKIMNTYEVLEKLCLAPAPSGYEKNAAKVFSGELEQYVDRIQLDRMGNVIGVIEGTDKSSPPAMIYAHMDQLGFIVRCIEPDGFLQIDRLGGIPEKALPALDLYIRTKDGTFIPGVIGNKAHHAASAADKYKVDEVTSLFVDIGARSAEEARALGVEIGNPAVYKPCFTRLSGERICGTSLDDRGGLAALLVAAELLSKKRPASDVYIVGTIWEEFNIRGAAFAARMIKPDVAIGLDVVLAGDTPDLKSRYQDIVGKGPTVNMYCFHGRGTLNGMIPHEGLVSLAEKAADAEGIPHQRFASLGIITESAYVQMENLGVACLDMGFPARYTHTPAETCSMTDIVDLGRLVAATVSALTPQFDKYRFRLD